MVGEGNAPSCFSAFSPVYFLPPAPEPQGHGAPTRSLVAAPLHLALRGCLAVLEVPCPRRSSGPGLRGCCRYLLHFWSSAVNNRLEDGRACLLQGLSLEVEVFFSTENF